MPVLHNIHVDGALRDEVVNVDLFLLAVSTRPSDGLFHGSVVFVSTFDEDGRKEDDVVRVVEVPMEC